MTSLDQDNYGGVRVEEIPGYFKNRLVSPCASCKRLFEDKEVCSVGCIELTDWKLNNGESMDGALVGSAACKVEKVEGRYCQQCSAKVVYEDRVLYCGGCLKVFFRASTVGEAVRTLIKWGWKLKDIRSVTGINRVDVNREARKLGKIPAYRKFTDEDRKAVVRYAAKHGREKAAKLWGLNIDTVGRYVRKFSIGCNEKFKRRKQQAAKLFADGMTVGQVAQKVGVAKSTAWKWHKSFTLG